KQAGKSTLSARKLWFDDQFGRLNEEEKGQYLGSFEAEDRILVIYDEGSYAITHTELTQRFEAGQIVAIEKFDPEKLVTAVYLDQERMQYTGKRFRIETTTLGTRFSFIREGKGNRLEAVTTDADPVLAISSGRGAQARVRKVRLAKEIDITGWKAVGVKL